jgi:hypothetical protein
MSMDAIIKHVESTGGSQELLLLLEQENYMAKGVYAALQAAVIENCNLKLKLREFTTGLRGRDTIVELPKSYIDVLHRGGMSVFELHDDGSESQVSECAAIGNGISYGVEGRVFWIKE